jgi:probable phosphoglycerate mutase
VALFSHGHLCRVLAGRWIGLSVEQAERLLLGTAAISILSYAHDRPEDPAIALWNSEADELSNPAPVQTAR